MDVKLLNNETVKLNTRMSLFTLKRAQEQELLSKDFIKQILNLGFATQSSDFNLSDLNENDLINLAYVCYKNNAENGLSQEEFESVFPLDLQLLVSILSEVLLCNSSVSTKTADNFRRVTNSNSQSKKKHQR